MFVTQTIRVKSFENVACTTSKTITDKADEYESR